MGTRNKALRRASDNKKENADFCILFFIEVTTRFELVIRELQSLALPLGYVTEYKCFLIYFRSFL